MVVGFGTYSITVVFTKGCTNGFKSLQCFCTAKVFHMNTCTVILQPLVYTFARCLLKNILKALSCEISRVAIPAIK